MRRPSVRRASAFWTVVVVVAGLMQIVGSDAATAVPAPVSLPGTPTQEAESNDTTTTATPMTSLPARFRGNIYPVGDVDFYSFAASAGDRVYVAPLTPSGNSDSNADIELIGSNGVTVIESDVDNGLFGNLAGSIAGATIPAAGQYFVKVVHGAGGQLFPYDLYLNIESGTPSSESEPNETSDTANPLPASGWVAGNVSPATDLDHFSFALADGETAFLSLDLDPERNDVEMTGGGMTIGSFGGTFNPVNDVGGTGPDSEAVAFTARTAGTYFVRVFSNGSTTGTYQLSVSKKAADTVECETFTSSSAVAIPSDTAGVVSSSIVVPTDVRIGRLAIDIDLTHSSMGDLDVVLSTPAGNDVALFDDMGLSPNASLTTRIDDNAALGLHDGLTTYDEMMLFPDRALSKLAFARGSRSAGTWTLTVYDDAANGGGNLNGWSVIICGELPPSVDTSLYTADFEANDAGFTHSGTFDEWEHGAPTLAPITTCGGGSMCWKTDLDGIYEPNASLELKSPSISLVGQSGTIYASWSHRYQMEDPDDDHYYVEIREVGGGGAVQRIFENFLPLQRRSVGNPLTTVDMTAGWSTVYADVSSFAGKFVEIVFHVDSDSSIHLSGVAVDDVGVFKGAAPADTDSDGVPDASDQCPGTATTPVGTTGCSIEQVRADGMIQKTGDPTVLGDDVYNIDGTNQTIIQKKRRGGVAKFDITIENDGDISQALNAQGCKGSRGFGITYFDGLANITAAVVAGTFSTGVLAPGASKTIQLRVKVGQSGPRGKQCFVAGWSPHFSSIKDSPLAKTVAKG